MTALAGSVAQAAAEAVPADGVFGIAWLLVVLPMVGAAVLLLVGRRGDRWGHWLGVAAPGASFLVALVLWIAMLGQPAGERVKDLGLGTWIRAGSFSVDAGLRIDPLSMTFVLLVTFVGTLIHVYSVAYMAHDADRRRFFGYLNLFVAAMLLLVLADSYVLLFVGWEGVGLASYLLIGFWNHELPNAVAAKKAFVVNRIGDIGLIVAIMAMFTVFGTTNIGLVGGLADSAGEGWLTAIGLMFLLAACGKSAQFPLQGWLGDAMAGPTPVSALIHAATMVTAWISAETGVGPAIASPSQPCSGNCADLPQAASRSISPMAVSQPSPAESARPPTRPMFVVPNTVNMAMIATISPMSPIRLTTNAFFAATALGSSWFQNPISR